MWNSLQPYLGQRLLVAVSGGADSVGLLRALCDLGAQLEVAHVDHSLRAVSVEDAEFVRALAERLQVPVHLKRLPTERICAAKGWGIEEGARLLRYQYLSQLAKTRACRVILTAHTLEDQAETVLLQLLRGTAKAVGMPRQRGWLHRPWLAVVKRDIRAYLQTLAQDWREDESNQDVRYTRNWLRADILPRLQERFPQAIAALSRYAQYAQEDDQLLDTLAAQLTPYSDVRREAPAVRRRWLVQQLKARQLSPDHGVLRRLEYALHQHHTQHVDVQQQIFTFRQGQMYSADTRAPEVAIPEHPAHWSLRHRQAGDRIRLTAGRRKLSDVLIDRKVPKWQRDQLWLLADDSDVEAPIRWIGTSPELWAVGFGRNSTPWWAEMGEALIQAQMAAQHQEVPIGAVVVWRGEIIARAHNRCLTLADQTQHAELQALQQASQKVGAYLNECTLVVTLEPCPMCLGAALESRVGRIVWGADNPKMGALGGVQDILRSHWGHTLEVDKGVRAQESAVLLKQFFEQQRDK